MVLRSQLRITAGNMQYVNVLCKFFDMLIYCILTHHIISINYIQDVYVLFDRRTIDISMKTYLLIITSEIQPSSFTRKLKLVTKELGYMDLQWDVFPCWNI